MDKPLTLFAEVDDTALARRFRATLEREQRTMKAVLLRAIEIYVAQSEAAEIMRKATPAPETA